MKTIFFGSILIVLMAIVSGQQPTRPVPPPVLKRTEVRDDSGQFALSYTTRDGTVFNEHGTLKRGPDNNGAVLIKEGSYNYISPDGTPIRLSYVADEFGFRPKGAHLPQPVQPIIPTF